MLQSILGTLAFRRFDVQSVHGSKEASLELAPGVVVTPGEQLERSVLGTGRENYGEGVPLDFRHQFAFLGKREPGVGPIAQVGKEVLAAAGAAIVRQCRCVSYVRSSSRRNLRCAEIKTADSDPSVRAR